MSTSIADTAVSGNSFSAGNGDADGGGRQPPASPSLLDYHRHQLYASGLTDATIAAAGIYSETSPERNGEMLNWDGPANDLSACLVYPYFDAAGQTVLSRLKPDSPRIDPCGKANQIRITARRFQPRVFPARRPRASTPSRPDRTNHRRREEGSRPRAGRVCGDWTGRRVRVEAVSSRATDR